MHYENAHKLYWDNKPNDLIDILHDMFGISYSHASSILVHNKPNDAISMIATLMETHASL